MRGCQHTLAGVGIEVRTLCPRDEQNHNDCRFKLLRIHHDIRITTDAVPNIALHLLYLEQDGGSNRHIIISAFTKGVNLLLASQVL